jgi:DNA-binding CsgD family transcriptional regulator
MDVTWPGVDASDESRRWMRDSSALLALPALWVDHEPIEIATGLLSVLFSVLTLSAGYARFNDPGNGRPMQSWRPSGPAAPAELQLALHTADLETPGIRSIEVGTGDSRALRVASLPLALPWGRGLVLVSAARSDFPTPMESHLLGVAVGQAAIAIHTARRLAHANAARASAEETLIRQNDLLRSLVDEADPSLRSISRRIREVSRLVTEVDAAHVSDGRRSGQRSSVPLAPETEGSPDHSLAPPLTRREIEVLGLLAQGLSNKEIAAVMWLSYRTVERHVTSVYRKIGVARRSEATAFALRQGMA